MFVIAALSWYCLFPSMPRELEGSKTAHLIPKRDRERLEYFFRRLIFWDGSGYVLMGSKPCSIALFQRPTAFSSHFLDSFTFSNIRFWLGWKTWEKYEHLFPHPCFSLLREDRANGQSLLIFINKAEFLQTVASHREDFESILKNPIEWNQLESKALFDEQLQNNDFLIGIILGYGRNNAWLYSQRNLFSEKTKPLVSFTDLQENERVSNYIASKGFWGFASGALFEDISKMPLPGFVVDANDPETKQLKVKYSKSREEIIQYYEGENFLDATLELFTKSSAVHDKNQR